MPTLRPLLLPLLAALALPAAPRVAVAQPVASPAPAAAADAPFTVRVVGSGRPILFIPGLMSGGDVWDATVDRLQRAGAGRHQLHVVTLAGFASVPAVPTDDFLGRATDALVAYARRTGLERPVVVGHSLGALLGYRMALAAPDLVGGVVAVDGVPFYSALFDSAATPASVRPQAAALRAAFASLPSAQLAQQVRAGAALQARDTAAHARLVRWAAASDPATVGQAMAEVMTTDLRGQLGAIRAPVLQIAAVGAIASPAMRAQVVARYAAQIAAIPRHELVVAERAHHFVMIDDPAFFDATLDRFLAATAPAAAGRR